MTAVRVASAADLADGGTLKVDLAGTAVALVRIGDDYYAIGDRCSHADVSLSGGYVEVDDCTLECPKHGSGFDLRSGAPTSLPATRAVPAWDVTVRDGEILLEES